MPTFPHKPLVDSHLICTDSNGLYMRFGHAGIFPDPYPEECFKDYEPVDFPLRWVKAYETVGEKRSVFPHEHVVDGKVVTNMHEIWLNDKLQGGYVRVVTPETSWFLRWLKHEETPVRAEAQGAGAWRFSRDDGYQLDCVEVEMTVGNLGPTRPFALSCTDSDGVASEWHPFDVAARFGFGVNEHPGGWWAPPVE